MAPFSTHGGLPPVVSFFWGNDTIYFSETIMSQLLPNGSGFGTFNTETTDPSLKLNAPVSLENGAEVLPGSVLRWLQLSDVVGPPLKLAIPGSRNGGFEFDAPSFLTQT